jgi:mannose-6-phosphate isomerase-like protein (cupin superfamily)
MDANDLRTPANDENGPFELPSTPVHLGLGATVDLQPTFTGDMSWYESYGARTESDGTEGRLVSMHTFTEPWDTWEMHPHGDELVLCVDGEIVLHQEHPDGTVGQVTLHPGQAVVNRPGVWHTADVAAPATAVFITAGVGTEIRPR